ncbi:MAG: potassium-transporting ATPase subunit KdpB [Campylobacterales bacterium]|nr:potassium-transporting ATPase subunit KdpB [Campylobacterales bacterium]
MKKIVQINNQDILKEALAGSFTRLNPKHQIKNPVIFAVTISSAFCTVLFLSGNFNPQDFWFNAQLLFWLWFTVLFANFAEALAEGRGKAQAASLKQTKSEMKANLINDFKNPKVVDASTLKKGDLVLVRAGEMIPSDGEVVEGVASVNESAITGESAPVIRESGGDRSSVTGGTTVISDWIKVRVTAAKGESFIDKMIALVEGAKRQKTPNEIALSLILIGFSLIFLLSVATLQPIVAYFDGSFSLLVLVSLFVCLIPTTIGGLLSAIGIAGMDRLLRKNVIASSGKAVETAGDISVLLLDKTGTITFGNRMASEFFAVGETAKEELLSYAVLSSQADETPEGRSIVALANSLGAKEISYEGVAVLIPFSADTRLSGVDFGKTKIRKGAMDSIAKFVEQNGGAMDGKCKQICERVAKEGATPLVIAVNGAILGVVMLKDIVKPGIKAKFAELRKMGIKTVMITGDNPLTAAAIAAEAGVDDFVAEATPETKIRLIQKYQQDGYLVAMTGDGTNDAPALAQADVGLAMNSGTQSAKEAANMIDLDSSPTKLLEIVEVGKQLLSTRGALTTFSIANDVAKYFAVIPALGVAIFPSLAALNVMDLASPKSAILSAVIFNALIIVALIPVALKGASFKAESEEAALRRNLAIYGLGGIVAPFVGIKLIDIIISACGMA